MKMKFIRTVFGIMLISGLAFATQSCKSKQAAVAPVAEQKVADEVEIVVPCTGEQYNSNAKAIRFSAIGESMDQMTAKKKAMSEARAGLAAAINTLVKGVTDNYVKSGNFNNKEELLKNYEGMNREVINQSLNGAVVICEKATKTKTGNYKYYVCMELGGSEILQALNNKATSNEMLKVDYNYEKFKKTFEEEMSKMGK